MVSNEFKSFFYGSVPTWSLISYYNIGRSLNSSLPLLHTSHILVCFFPTGTQRALQITNARKVPRIRPPPPRHQQPPPPSPHLQLPLPRLLPPIPPHAPLRRLPLPLARIPRPLLTRQAPRPLANPLAPKKVFAAALPRSRRIAYSGSRARAVLLARHASRQVAITRTRLPRPSLREGDRM